MADDDKPIYGADLEALARELAQRTKCEPWRLACQRERLGEWKRDEHHKEIDRG